MPTAADVDPATLAERFSNVCGRDIKNAVIDAAVRAAVAGADGVTARSLEDAIERVIAARIEPRVRRLSTEEKTSISEKIRNELRGRRTHGSEE